MSDGWLTIGHLNDCLACRTEVPPFNTADARYLWHRCSTAKCCATRLCVECCARWREEVSQGRRDAPYRISELHLPDRTS